MTRRRASSKTTPPEAPARIVPVSVLTGFLGSGKTTVLNHLIQQPALRRTLVLINEFGEIGLDHDLVTQAQDDVVIAMSSGCLCCTIRGDLATTLSEAPARFARNGKTWFDRVVIETTGLADPAPILHTLMTEPTLARLYRLDGVITTVDAMHSSDTLDRQIESVKQAAVADRLLLTKADLAAVGTLATLQRRLRALNPAAPQIVAEHGVVDPASLFDAGLYNPRTKSLDVQRWLNAEAYPPPDHQHATTGHDANHGHGHHQSHHHNDVNRHDQHIKALCLTIDKPIPSYVVDLWFEALLMLRGPDFLRIKGILNVAGLGAPMVIHGVQHIFHPPIMLQAWPSEDRRSRIVFITRNIDESALRDTLKMFTEECDQPSLHPDVSGDDDIALFEARG
ncbi:MAG: GTP-binding protein [Rhodospirillales bacterium]|nr:GTP-binding protein [Rhodospirillales bacterium]